MRKFKNKILKHIKIFETEYLKKSRQQMSSLQSSHLVIILSEHRCEAVACNGKREREEKLNLIVCHIKMTSVTTGCGKDVKSHM